MAGTSGPGAQYLGIGKESTYGTAVAPTRLYEVESESFQLETIQDVREGFVKDRDTVPGLRSRTIRTGVMGSFTMPVWFNGMGVLFEAIFGTPSTTWAKSTVSKDPMYLGAWTADSFGARPSYTIMVARSERDGDLTKFYYTGCVVTNVSITVGQNEAMMVTVDWAGYNESTASVSGSEGAYATKDSWFHFDDATLTVAGTAATSVKSFSLDMSFGINTDLRYMVGSSLRQKPIRSGIPVYTGSADVDVNDLAYHKLWEDGSKAEIILDLSHDFVNSDGTWKRELTVKLPYCIVTSAPPQSTPTELTTQTVAFRAHDPEDSDTTYEVGYRSRDATL